MNDLNLHTRVTIDKNTINEYEKLKIKINEKSQVKTYQLNFFSANFEITVNHNTVTITPNQNMYSIWSFDGLRAKPMNTGVKVLSIIISKDSKHNEIDNYSIDDWMIKISNYPNHINISETKNDFKTIITQKHDVFFKCEQ